MKNLLLYACIFGAMGWLVSEIMELAGGGFTSASLLVSAITFFLLAIGWWGLHLSQTSESSGDTLSMIGTALVSLGFVLFGVIALQMMGLEEVVERELASSTLFLVASGSAVLGGILFGISILRLRYFPNWTGIVLLVLMAAAIIIPLAGVSGIALHVGNMLLSFMLIFMGYLGLEKEL